MGPSIFTASGFPQPDRPYLFEAQMISPQILSLILAYQYAVIEIGWSSRKVAYGASGP